MPVAKVVSLLTKQINIERNKTFRVFQGSSPRTSTTDMIEKKLRSKVKPAEHRSSLVFKNIGESPRKMIFHPKSQLSLLVIPASAFARQNRFKT